MSHTPAIRRIAHLDMDAFYASVEWLRYPQLRGLPMVIGGGRRREDELIARLNAERPERSWTADDLADIPVDFFPLLKDYVGRGVITTASYAAREFGVGSAMGLMKAARLCPQAILLPADFDQYRHYSRAFKAVIREIAPVMEDRGIDEVYIDFTDVPGGQREGGRVLARLIQKGIFQATGLTCSVGVAPNKLLAKMASEFNKPNGISIVLEGDLQTQIWPLPCRKINGVGPKADARLQGHGIRTIGELAARELVFRPRFWLSDEWFSPAGVPGVGIPFYLAHPRLMRLERHQMFEVEGGTREGCLRLLRHELGHAVDHAYRLSRRKDWRDVFGSASLPYPDAYRPNPASKRFVQHLDGWYAQAHPDEDFAETFAVWMTPRAR